MNYVQTGVEKRARLDAHRTARRHRHFRDYRGDCHSGDRRHHGQLEKDAHIANAKQVASAARLAIAADNNTKTSYTLKQLYDDGYLENIPKSPGKHSTAKYDEDKSKVDIVKETDKDNNVTGILYKVKLVDDDGEFVYIDGSKDVNELTRKDVKLE